MAYSASHARSMASMTRTVVYRLFTSIENSVSFGLNVVVFSMPFMCSVEVSMFAPGIFLKKVDNHLLSLS